MDSELVMTTFLRGDNEHKYKARQISNSINPMYGTIKEIYIHRLIDVEYAAINPKLQKKPYI